jgi:hypothetical protein
LLLESIDQGSCHAFERFARKHAGCQVRPVSYKRTLLGRGISRTDTARLTTASSLCKLMLVGELYAPGMVRRSNSCSHPWIEGTS